MTQITEKMLLRLKDGKTIRVKHVDLEDEGKYKGQMIASISGRGSYKEATACSLVLVSELERKIESGEIKVVTLVWDATENKWQETIQ